MKILVIEDEPSLQELIVKALEKERFVVETASTYKAAIQKVSLLRIPETICNLMVSIYSTDFTKEVRKKNLQDSDLLL